ncbi:MAG: DUF1638 domain-containing protein [Candidatus Sumerlaeia bacterium]|nr:DUF1638 domain-containing protein [Candidatus Sumerlaeia bacterium]
MYLKLIACEVFTREICYCVARTPHIVDIEFTPKGAHDKSEYLRQEIQLRIDATQQSPRKYDAILLGYGLCGNATVNLLARDTPLVIPRAHDCCTILLGSKEKYKLYFGRNPSLMFSSSGYMERGDSYVKEASVSKLLGLDKNYADYVAQYGEENARFLFDNLFSKMTLPPENKIIFIEVPETQHLGYSAKCRQQAQAEGREFIQLPGDIRLIKHLLYGEWNNDEFLIVKPHQRTVGVYDAEEIICAENIS